MSQKIGLWLDYERALIVRLNEASVEIDHINSSVEPKRRSTGGVRSSRPYWHRSVNSAKKQDTRRDQEIQRYFSELEAALGKPDSLYIVGPGEAKQNFRNYLLDDGFSENQVDFCDTSSSRETEGQIVARIKAHFGMDAPRLLPR